MGVQVNEAIIIRVIDVSWRKAVFGSHAGNFYVQSDACNVDWKWRALLYKWIESNEHCYNVLYPLVPNFQPGAARDQQVKHVNQSDATINNCNNLQIDSVQFCGDGCVSALSLGLLYRNF